MRRNKVDATKIKIKIKKEKKTWENRGNINGGDLSRGLRARKTGHSTANRGGMHENNALHIDSLDIF